MKQGFVLRGQGLGLVMDRVFENWPTRKAFEEVMKKELELHGFEADGTPRERWVRVQTIEIDDGIAKVFEDLAPGKPNEFQFGKLSQEEADAIRSPNPAPGGTSSTQIQMSGEGTVTNPSDVAELKL